MKESESKFNEPVFEEELFIGGHAVAALKEVGSFSSLEDKKVFITRAFAAATMLEYMRKEGVVVRMKDKEGRPLNFAGRDGKKIDFYTNLIGPQS